MQRKCEILVSPSTRNTSREAAGTVFCATLNQLGVCLTACPFTFRTPSDALDAIVGILGW